MNITQANTLLATDVYKMGHMVQYLKGTSKVYSYLQCRSTKTFPNSVFFGLQYYLKEYLSTPITAAMVVQFLEAKKDILGHDPKQLTDSEIETKLYALADLGYWPVKIKAVPEGSVINNGNVLMTIESPHEGFHWVVGFIESLLLKVWYPLTVGACCYQYRQLVETMFDKTVDLEMHFLKDFMVHDFGYRGDSSEEGAAISGAAHLLSFNGSDTVPSLAWVRKYYNADPGPHIMSSVPASEHSVMCSFGKENELAAFENMLDLYPTGLVSIVSDTYDIYKVCTDFLPRLKDRILARDGKCVIRPDSGNPEHIINGDPNAAPHTPEGKGVLRLLDEVFGHTVNSKGYKVLNGKIGLIYGDGMYYDRYKRTLETMETNGYAACNLVIGVGGILRNHSRDTLGCAIKATYIEVDGKGIDIEKEPVTDRSKKSHKGRLRLNFAGGKVPNLYVTVDQCDDDLESGGGLCEVFKNGKILIDYKFEDVRARCRGTL